MQRLSKNKLPRRPKRFSQRSLCFGFLGFFGILYLYVVSKFAVSTNAYLGGDYDNSSSNSNSPLGTSSSMLNGHDRNDNGNGSLEDLKLKKKKIGTLGSDLVVPDVRIPDKITTVAYAISLTGCKAGFTIDGAAVLKHSIELSSYPINTNSKYASKMILFAHPDALECAKPIEKLGYELQVKETPIDASQIKTEFLREKVVKTGCCGDKEFLKLYAYTLTDYPIAVHLDLDALVLQPFDDLFDSMLHGDNGALPVMYNKSVPENIEAYYTKDYNMINPGHAHPGMQGGFLVIKPNMKYFEEYKSIILEGDFQKGAGWAGKFGGYFGAQQIQGLCSYFFEGVHPGTAVELNRCIYNAMNDAPKGKKRRRGDELFCLDGKETCEDCRETEFEKIKSVHFTLCQKPWICPRHSLQQPNCRKFMKSWFAIRKNLDEKNGVETSTENINFHNDVFQGLCTGQGAQNYKKYLEPAY